MSRRSARLFRHATVLGALLASLTMSILPNGLMPKVAGPCGRELCDCRIFIDMRHPLFSCGECKANTLTGNKPLRALRLVDTEISSSHAQGLAYQFVFSGLLMPKTTKIIRFVSVACDTVKWINRPFALTCAHSEILTPPPRSSHAV